jgi:nitroreductase
MDAIEAIMNRRSIRKFTDKPLPDGAIDTLLKAAMAAPTAGTQLPWHFIVVKDKAVLKRIAETNKNAQMCASAQAGVLIIGDPTNERFGVFWQQDMGACIQNFLLAVHAEGLAACWTGIYPREERTENFRKDFGVPEHLIPLAFIPVGYADEEKGPSDRYDETRVHAEKW